MLLSSWLGRPAQLPRPVRRLEVESLEDRCLMAASLSISDVLVLEGGTKDSNVAVFTVSLSEAADQTVTVDFSTADATATANNDYIAVAGTLTFAPGETSKTITVEIKGDNRVEDDELFNVDLFGAVNALIADGQGWGVIANDDHDHKRDKPCRVTRCGP